MDKIRVIFTIAFYNLKKWIINPRIYLIFILTTLYLHSRISPISTFCLNSGYKISPYIFPYLMSDRSIIFIIMMGVVLLFCDAPFIEIDQPYIIMRSGRITWLWGQLAYIALASMLYFVIMIVLSILILLPNLSFSADWGKVIGTFAQTNVANQHLISIPFDFLLYNSYSPLSAMFFSFTNSFLVAIFIGILIFVFNLNISRFAGVITSTLLVLWHMVTYMTWTGSTRYSPITWVSLAKIDINGNTLYPSLPYIYFVISTLIIILILLAIMSIRKRDINVIKSV